MSTIRKSEKKFSVGLVYTAVNSFHSSTNEPNTPDFQRD